MIYNNKYMEKLVQKKELRKFIANMTKKQMIFRQEHRLPHADRDIKEYSTFMIRGFEKDEDSYWGMMEIWDNEKWLIEHKMTADQWEQKWGRKVELLPADAR